MSPAPTTDYPEAKSIRAADVMATWVKVYGAGGCDRECPPSEIVSQAAPPDPTSRGGADALAAWKRWHDTRLDALFTASELPWYAVLERARVEILAGRRLRGMALNLADTESISPAHSAMARLYRTARHMIDAKADADKSVLDDEDHPEAGPHNVPSGEASPSMPGFHPEFFDRSRRRPGEEGRAPQVSILTEAFLAGTLHQVREILSNGRSFAEQTMPLVRALAGYFGDFADEKADLTPPGAPLMESTELDSVEKSDADTESTDARGVVPLIEKAYPGYSVSTTAWDEMLPASAWYRSSDSELLEQIRSADRRDVRRLAHRLQRRLMAGRMRYWSFDREEGLLDSKRLTRLLSDSGTGKVFRIEEEAPSPEACVVLLVDQSGSMYGARQILAALAIDLAVHTMEACGVRCEVLGYTSRFGSDNPMIRRWRDQGSPVRPGRLNALRHIVYKTAEQPWRRVRPQLGLMLRKGFGQENIDGESLYWAAGRLLFRPEKRKILMVFSDGEPYDEASAIANGRPFLENHLRAVIRDIESSPIHLVAIGAGRETGRFYRRALTLRRPESVAEVLFQSLADLLVLPDSAPSQTNRYGSRAIR